MIFIIPLPIQDKLEIKPTIEIRERHEHRSNRDFSRAVSDSRSDFLTRIRAGATAKFGKHWSFALQYQYAHDWIDKSGTKSTDEASDFSLGYAQYKGESGTLTLGRQKIALGTERLIGSAEWLNAARSVDGRKKPCCRRRRFPANSLRRLPP